MGLGNADRFAVSGIMATAKKIRGKAIRKDMSAAVMEEPITRLQSEIKPVGMKKPRGMGFKKGSQEAKDHMARIRAMRKKN
jgi:hypothetical protein